MRPLRPVGRKACEDVSLFLLYRLTPGKFLVVSIALLTPFQVPTDFLDTAKQLQNDAYAANALTAKTERDNATDAVRQAAVRFQHQVKNRGKRGKNNDQKITVPTVDLRATISSSSTIPTTTGTVSPSKGGQQAPGQLDSKTLLQSIYVSSTSSQ